MTEGGGRSGKKLTTEMLAHVWTKLVPEATMTRVAAVWDSPFDDGSNQPCTVRWMNVACSEDRDNSELRDSLSCGWKFGWIGEVVSPKKTPSGEVLGIVCSLSSFPVQSSHFEFSRTQCHLNGVFHPHFFSSVIALRVFFVLVWYGMVWQQHRMSHCSNRVRLVR